MEVEQHQGLEMAQVTSEVYDIIHPSPVSLKQLSTIAISLELWRLNLNEYRTRGKLKPIHLYSLQIGKGNTRLKKKLSDLPSVIYQMIDEVLPRFEESLSSWVKEHDREAYHSYILHDFDDFSCDYDGSIHYARTAERMMRCEGFSSEMKFKVACMYFFEDDIRRIWPSISANMNVDLIDFDKCPAVYYWICRLTNKLDKIPTCEGETVDERMFEMSMHRNRPSVEYFWNRTPLENLQSAGDKLKSYNFVRFILPKLNDEQLDKFFNDGNGGRLRRMFRHLSHDEWILLRTWVHIRNIINESNFTNLVIRMFDMGTFNWVHWEDLSCQIWDHTPLNLKQSAIRVLSSDSSWFRNIGACLCNDRRCSKMNVELLLTILRDASLKERNLFWSNCWSCLILIKPLQSKDLQRVIELCFENKNEINQFKQNVIVKSGDVLEYCVSLLNELFYFDDLNAFVSFCCPKSKAARNFRQRILRSAFLGEECKLRDWRPYSNSIENLNQFVNDAFDDYDLSADFKHLFMSSTSFLRRLASIMCKGHVPLCELTEFIDTFVSTEEVLSQVKLRLIDSLKEYGTTNAIDHRYICDLDEILPWCLGSNEGVEEFKLNCLWKSEKR